MSMTATFTIIGTLALAGALASAVVARWKGRSADYWGMFGFIFPPIVLLLLCLPRVGKAAEGKKIKPHSPPQTPADLAMHRTPKVR